MTEMLLLVGLIFVAAIVAFIKRDWLLNVNCARRHDWTGVYWEDADISKFDSPTVVYQSSQRRACRRCGYQFPHLNAGFVWTQPTPKP